MRVLPCEMELSADNKGPQTVSSSVYLETRC